MRVGADELHGENVPERVLQGGECLELPIEVVLT
jgi:hypothetical protein